MPSICIFTEEQALLDISAMSIAALNIEEVEPSNAEDAFIATIRAIRATALPMMDTSSGQVRQPPEEQKENEQEAIHTLQCPNMG